MNKFVAMLAAAAAVAAGTPAAATDTATRTVKVRYADLDLSTRAGRATLDRRIDAALEQVCGSLGPTVNNEERVIATCRTEAAARIASRIAALRSKERLAAR